MQEEESVYEADDGDGESWRVFLHFRLMRMDDQCFLLDKDYTPDDSRRKVQEMMHSLEDGDEDDSMQEEEVEDFLEVLEKQMSSQSLWRSDQKEVTVYSVLKQTSKMTLE